MPTLTEHSLAVKPAIEALSAVGGKPHIVIVIPGIRTNAAWVHDANDHLRDAWDRERLSSPPLIFKTALPDRIPVWRLLLRWRLDEYKAGINTEIQYVLEHNKEARVSILCHSIGTDLFADYATKSFNKFEKVFLIGSICPKRKLINIARIADMVVNFRSTNDHWSIIASIIRPDKYEPTGVFGFNAVMADEFCHSNDHRTCTDLPFMRDAIIPALNDEKLILRTNNKLAYDYTWFVNARRIFVISIIATLISLLIFSFSVSAMLAIVPITILVYYIVPRAMPAD